MATKADVLKWAPEFATLPESDFTFALAEADLVVLGSAWGARIESAKALFAAHLLTIVRPASAARPDVVSESVGGVSRTYAVGGAAAQDDLDETKYGRLFKRMRRSSFACSAQVL